MAALPAATKRFNATAHVASFRFNPATAKVVRAARARVSNSADGHTSSVDRRPLTASEAKAPTSTVAITGATGWIGRRVVNRLLSQGHAVHAVCHPSELQAVKPVHHLKSLPGASDRLRLFGGDVTEPGACDAALQGAQHMVHLAAFVQLTCSREEQERMVHTAMTGTRNVLDSVTATRGSVQSVVMCSSIAAIVADNRERGKDHVYSEKDWAVQCDKGHNTYHYAKRESEQLAYRMAAEANLWRLVTLNPGLVLGPVSHLPVPLVPASLLSMFTGGPRPGLQTFPLRSVAERGAPVLDLQSGWVDVDDVAAAVCSALFTSDAKGRHLLVSASTGMHAIYDMIKQQHPVWDGGKGKSSPPTALLKTLAWALRTTTGYDMQTLADVIGRPIKLDSSHALTALGLGSYIPFEQTVMDTVSSLDALGLVQMTNTAAATATETATDRLSRSFP